MSGSGFLFKITPKLVANAEALYYYCFPISTSLMKNGFKTFLLVCIFLTALCFSGTSQDVIRQVACYDAILKAQADSMKVVFAKQGFIVVREATMTMESEYEMPVVVPLNQGSWYQFIFIGDMSSKLYELRMFDYDEKQVVYEKHFGNGMESNIISYSFIPKFSEYHMIKPVQVNKKKKKDICGYIIMLKKVR